MTLDGLYRQCHRRLLQRTLAWVDRHDDAEEACGCAWVIFARRLPDLELADAGEALAYLTTVARHELHGIWHQRRREDVLRASRDEEGDLRDIADQLAALAGGADDAAAHELIALRETLPQLTRGRQAALTCRMLGLTYRQAAAATGRSHTWINRGITEGRRALREALA